jgi:hypothetical protein
MERQAALLLGRLGRHEPHVGPSHCLTNCLGISGIILMPLYVGLDVGWRHQALVECAGEQGRGPFRQSGPNGKVPQLDLSRQRSGKENPGAAWAAKTGIFDLGAELTVMQDEKLRPNHRMNRDQTTKFPGMCCNFWPTEVPSFGDAIRNCVAATPYLLGRSYAVR